MIKKILILSLCVVLIIVLISIYFGFSSALHAAIVYISIAYVITLIFKPELNWKTAIFSICLSLIVVEFGLGFSLPHEQLTYLNPVKKNSLRALLYKTIYPNQDIHYHSGPANSTYFSTSLNEFSYKHQYNSLGLREEEPNSNPIQNKTFLLALGDSFTEGAGAPIDSTWVAQVERLLSTQKGLAINAGSISSDILFEFYKLDSKLYERYQPKQVILTINKTDILDFIENGGVDRFQDPNRLIEIEGPWWSFFYTFSPLSRYFFHNVLNYDEFGSEEYSRYKEVESITAIQQTLLLFKEHAKENDYAFALVIIPLQEEIEASSLRLASLDAFCKKSEIPVFNFYQYLIQNEMLYQKYYWQNDGHLNSSGYTLLGQLIYEHLILKEQVNY
jgi:hypothetical protein